MRRPTPRPASSTVVLPYRFTVMNRPSGATRTRETGATPVRYVVLTACPGAVAALTQLVVTWASKPLSDRPPVPTRARTDCPFGPPE